MSKGTAEIGLLARYYKRYCCGVEMALSGLAAFGTILLTNFLPDTWTKGREI
jgi:hypothetical protein